MNIIKIIFLTLFLSGCATVVRLPNSTGQVPEARGGFLKGHFGLDVVTTTPVTIINDITASPVTRSRIGVGEDANVIGQAIGFDAFGGSRLDGSLGLLKRLDFYINRSVGLRFQFLGDPIKEGWKASVFGGAHSLGQTTGQGSESTTLYEAATKMHGQEFGFSFGKRTSVNTLFFMTLASRGGKADIDVLVNSATTEEYRDEYDHYIVSLGTVLGSSWYFKGEITANSIQWKGEDSAGNTIEDSGSEAGFNIGFGYRWGTSEEQKL